MKIKWAVILLMVITIAVAIPIEKEGEAESANNGEFIRDVNKNSDEVLAIARPKPPPSSQNPSITKGIGLEGDSGPKHPLAIIKREHAKGLIVPEGVKPLELSHKAETGAERKSRFYGVGLTGFGVGAFGWPYYGHEGVGFPYAPHWG